MAGSPKKTKAEKAKTRQAANSRYRQKKAGQGLKLVSVWLPETLAEAIKDKARIGIVIADEGDHPEAICVKWVDGRFEEVDWQKNLLDIARNG